MINQVGHIDLQTICTACTSGSRHGVKKEGRVTLCVTSLGYARASDCQLGMERDLTGSDNRDLKICDLDVTGR